MATDGPETPLQKATRLSRDTFYESSGMLSTIVRQLGFAGIAIVWVFTTKRTGHGYTMPWAMKLALLLVVISLTLDVLQYLYKTVAWGRHYRDLEKGRARPEDPHTGGVLPESIGDRTYAIWKTKVGVMFAAYVILAIGVIGQL